MEELCFFFFGGQGLCLYVQHVDSTFWLKRHNISTPLLSKILPNTLNQINCIVKELGYIVRHCTVSSALLLLETVHSIYVHEVLNFYVLLSNEIQENTIFFTAL